MSVHFVYVLYSDSFHRFYIGSSANPQKRLQSHNDPRNKGWTRRYAPWRLMYTEECINKHEALTREKYLKTGIGRDYIKTLFANTQ